MMLSGIHGMEQCLITITGKAHNSAHRISALREIRDRQRKPRSHP